MRQRKVDGPAVQRAREDAGYTQVALAAKLRVDRSAIAQWESGYTQPSASNFKALCAALKVRRDALLLVADDAQVV
ncbi:hypothetical protein B1813_18825 [Saccharomonospora piscinae]|uniref:HTH cro/C1-type domain-containing protein n=1 Tax=Saccharomonospora piscinae TaxID=687388 RepID=A0A1V8ZY78_SACPI|nr:helix-turn-helix transcriptional regulator [Saccharomonospora piscinae]OQO89897.1 hypothetical protein B1813_18825 [Saccharomonospora piscinae]